MGHITHATSELWIGFISFVILLLVVDLGLLNRDSRRMGFKRALGWTIFWVSVTLAFNIFLYRRFGSGPALEFFTGYIIEYSLSVDNLFIFMIIFSYFKVPDSVQRRVLFFGILGAIVMRGVFIALGSHLLDHFHWIMYVFGGILLISGAKLFSQNHEDIHPEKNVIYRFCKRLFPLVSEYHGEKFFVRKNKKLFATPLFLVLISVEVTDLIFAVDSIPAIFAITIDPFIVFTSNIFAILGLRSLYFLISGAIGNLHYLNRGLAVVLAFVGIKMLTSSFMKIPTVFSLLIIVSIIGVSIIASILYRRKHS